MRDTVVIGTRGSRLALTQTNGVADLLRALAPHVALRIEVISTRGDHVVDQPLAAIGDKGLFTKEIETALLQKRIDLAVHSMKDLPTELPDGLRIGGVPSRANPHDALVARGVRSLEELSAAARVGTSSLRRRAQLLAYRPDLTLVDLRGNVDTRLRRVADGELDAAVLACAGLERLGKAGMITEVLSTDIMVPAPAQGALAIEIRVEDGELCCLLRRLADVDAEAEVAAERALLAALGGGCRVPIGALGRVCEGTLTLRASVCSPDGARVLRTTVAGPSAEAALLGARAADLLMKDGAAEIIDGVIPRLIVGRHRTAVVRAIDEAQPGPLKGKKVVVTRARDQAGELVEQFERLGAEVFEFPTIEIVPAAEPLVLDKAGYDWLVLTSVNAAEALFTELTRQGRKPENLAAHVAVIGPAVAHMAAQHGLRVDLMPEKHVAEELFAALAVREAELSGKRVLLPRSDLARAFLPDALRQRGGEVVEWIAYRTACPNVSVDSIKALLDFTPDVVTFASSSSISNFCQLLGAKHLEAVKKYAVFASIGPQTTRTAAQFGLDITIESQEHTTQGLVQAVVVALRR